MNQTKHNNERISQKIQINSLRFLLKIFYCDYLTF